MEQLYVLIVEDSIYWGDLNARELKKAGFAVHYQVVSSRSAMYKALTEKCWDIIISDNNMPGFDANQALEVRNRLGCTTPFIIVSEDIQEKDIERAKREGCLDYVSKEQLSALGKRVKEIINRVDT